MSSPSTSRSTPGSSSSTDRPGARGLACAGVLRYPLATGAGSAISMRRQTGKRPRPGMQTAETETDWVLRQFTRSDGAFRFARWGRAPVPAAFGAGEAGAEALTEGLRAVASITGLGVAGEDPDLGVNFLVFTVAEWRDLAAVPHLAKLIPDLERLVTTL